MPSMPRLPVRSALGKASDVPVTAMSLAYRVAAYGANELRTRPLPRVVGGLVGAGLGGVAGAAGDLAVRLSRFAGSPSLATEAPTTGSETSEDVRAAPAQQPAPPAAAVAAGAPGTATGEAEAARRDAEAHGVDLEHALDRDELPIPDYDSQTVGSLRPKLARLDADELVLVRAYEQAHANRIQVNTMIENRIAKLRRQAGSGADAPTS